MLTAKGAGAPASAVPGLSIAGDLNPKVWSNGQLTGTLKRTSGTIKLEGQIKGDLIGFYINLGKGRNVFGTGTVGHDPTAKAEVLGG